MSLPLFGSVVPLEATVAVLCRIVPFAADAASFTWIVKVWSAAGRERSSGCT